MESVTFGQCVKGAWRDAWRFVQRRPVLVLTIFVAAWIGGGVESVLHPDGQPPFRPITYVPLGLFVLLKSAIFSVPVVQTLRFVLLGAREAQPAPLFGRDFWRYVGFTYAMTFLFMVMVLIPFPVILGAVVLLHEQRHGVVSHLIVILVLCAGVLAAFCLVFFVGTRLSLLSTQIAIGRAVLWGPTWADTRGHCWSILTTHMVATLPILAVAIPLAIASAFAPPHAVLGLSVLVQALSVVASLVVGAACAAWIYRRYAVSLGARA
jgi:hypothetical protein